ncbi:unnamed protein product, partial [marine sediment metagenome]
MGHEEGFGEFIVNTIDAYEVIVLGIPHPLRQ